MSTNFAVDDWVSQAEAARLRGVTRQAIAKLAKANRIRSIEIGGRFLVSKEDVLNFEPQKPGRPKNVEV